MKKYTFTIQSSDSSGQKECEIELSSAKGLREGSFYVGEIRAAIWQKLYANTSNTSNKFKMNSIPLAIFLHGQEQISNQKILTAENMKNTTFYVREKANLMYAPNYSINVYYLPDVTAQDLKPAFLDIFEVPVENITVAIYRDDTNIYPMQDEQSLCDAVVQAKSYKICATLSSNLKITKHFNTMPQTFNTSNTSVAQVVDETCYTITANLLLPDRTMQQCIIDGRATDTVADIKKQIAKHIPYPAEQLSISSAQTSQFPKELLDVTSLESMHLMAAEHQIPLVIFLKKEARFYMMDHSKIPTDEYSIYFAPFATVSEMKEQFASKIGLSKNELKFFRTVGYTHAYITFPDDHCLGFFDTLRRERHICVTRGASIEGRADEVCDVGEIDAMTSAKIIRARSKAVESLIAANTFTRMTHLGHEKDKYTASTANSSLISRTDDGYKQIIIREKKEMGSSKSPLLTDVTIMALNQEVIGQVILDYCTNKNINSKLYTWKIASTTLTHETCDQRKVCELSSHIVEMEAKPMIPVKIGEDTVDVHRTQEIGNIISLYCQKINAQVDRFKWKMNGVYLDQQGLRQEVKEGCVIEAEVVIDPKTQYQMQLRAAKKQGKDDECRLL